MGENLHPYVVFLPSEQKIRVLSAIFGSKAAVEILKFSLNRGIANEIYQRDLVKNLSYSNKTTIQNLKAMARLGVLKEEMRKTDKNGRIVWLKTYQLSDAGRWFALLLAKEKELTEKEKAEILQSIFRTYVRWVKDFSQKLGVSKKTLQDIFTEELR